MARAFTLLWVLGLVVCVPVTATAQEACDSGRGGPALATGPLQVSLLGGQLGLPRRACPRSEAFITGDLSLVAELAEFYGNIRSNAIVGGSWAITERTEVFATFEAFRFQTVISSISAKSFGTGYLSLGALQQIYSGEGVSLAFAGRLVLPSSTLDQNSKPLAMDLGLNLAWVGHEVVSLHAALAFAGSIGISNGPAVPRGGVRLMVGLDIHPLRWLAIVIELHTAFGYRGVLDLVAPGVGFRFAIRQHVGIELGAIVPVAGEERALVAGALQLSWRFGGPTSHSQDQDDEEPTP